MKNALKIEIMDYVVGTLPQSCKFRKDARIWNVRCFIQVHRRGIRKDGAELGSRTLSFVCCLYLMLNRLSITVSARNYSPSHRADTIRLKRSQPESRQQDAARELCTLSRFYYKIVLLDVKVFGVTKCARATPSFVAIRNSRYYS